MKSTLIGFAYNINQGHTDNEQQDTHPSRATAKSDLRNLIIEKKKIGETKIQKKMYKKIKGLGL